MQKVFYPGHAGQPCIGEYAIVLDRSDTFARADIVLVNRQAHGGSSFCNSGIGRDSVLNRILANDLNRIRLEWIRVFLLIETTAPTPGRLSEFFGVEIKKIEIDMDDYIARGNPCTMKRRNIMSRLFTGISKDVCYWSGDAVGGCAKVTTSAKGSRHLDPDEIRELRARIGLHSASPTDPARHKGPAASRNTLSSSAYH